MDINFFIMYVIIIIKIDDSYTSNIKTFFTAIVVDYFCLINVLCFQ